MALTFNPGLMRQEQADLYELEASPVEFQDIQNYTEKSCLQSKKQNKTKIQTNKHKGGGGGEKKRKKRDSFLI